MHEGSDRRPFTASEFIQGIIAVLVLCHRHTIYLDGGKFEANVAKIFDRLCERADEFGIDLRFRIRPHYIHGYSETVMTELFRASQAGMLSFTIPFTSGNFYFRITLTNSEAHAILEHFPIPKDVFLPLVKKFLVD